MSKQKNLKQRARHKHAKALNKKRRSKVIVKPRKEVKQNSLLTLARKNAISVAAATSILMSPEIAGLANEHVEFTEESKEIFALVERISQSSEKIWQERENKLDLDITPNGDPTRVRWIDNPAVRPTRLVAQRLVNEILEKSKKWGEKAHPELLSFGQRLGLQIGITNFWKTLSEEEQQEKLRKGTEVDTMRFGLEQCIRELLLIEGCDKALELARWFGSPAKELLEEINRKHDQITKYGIYLLLENILIT